MRTTQTNAHQQGFTLIEMLVIAPFVALLIAGLVVFMATLTGDTLKQNSKNRMAYEVQNALSIIERDATTATAFLSSLSSGNTNYPIAKPQGSDNNTAGYTTNTDLTVTGRALIIKSPATTTNPLASSRALVYLATPDTTCSAGNLSGNDIYPVLYVYFVKNATLWRRTIKGSTTVGICNGASAWQRASCAAEDIATNSTICKAADEELVHNIDQMNVSYFADASGTSPNTTYTWTESQSPESIQVTIIAKQNTSGVTTDLPSFSGSLRVSSVNIR